MKTIAIALVFASLLLAGCAVQKKSFVCPDGTKTVKKELCGNATATPKPTAIVTVVHANGSTPKLIGCKLPFCIPLIPTEKRDAYGCPIFECGNASGSPPKPSAVTATPQNTDAPPAPPVEDGNTSGTDNKTSSSSGISSTGGLPPLPA